MRAKISAITKTIAMRMNLKTMNMREFSAIPGFRKSITSFFNKKPSNRTYSAHAHCDAHMNELPIPCGPWEPWYNEQQAYYNKVLLVGVAWFAVSFILMIYTGSFFLNWGPPAQPGPPSDSVEECSDADT